ncbi:MAG: xanthine dehydrogenase family protein molybdopterin-binding subunit [Chloroflexota bacterium]
MSSTTEVGKHRKRVEDPRLVRGEGQYVDDISLPGTVDVAFVRSTYAHARIKGIDVSGARAVDGFRAVFDGEALKDSPRLPNRIPIQEKHISPMPHLARGYVTYVGYPIVAVVANGRYAARDAADRIEVDYEPLPVVTSGEEALKPGAPILHPSLGTNVAYRFSKEGGDVDAAFATATHTIRRELRHNRLAQIPMEPRAILAHYDRAADLLTVWRSTQSPFGTRSTLAEVLGRDEEKIRVIAPDVGGGFGAKGSLYPDEMVAVLIAMQLGVPVRWVSTRMEDMQSTMQGRDQHNTIDLAFEPDGTIKAFKVSIVHNVGGVLMSPMATPPMRVADFAVGAYRTPAFRAEAVAAYTNTPPTGPYRGAGRPEAAFACERGIEEVARFLNMDPIEIRRKNFLSPSQFPYKTPVGSVYDSGDYNLALDRALEILEYDKLRLEQKLAREAGEILGIGVATTIEVSGQGNEYGSVEIEPDGSVIARTGSSSHGQGHETSFAQVVADKLGVPFERVRVLHGDTRETPAGFGTGGSRSMVVGGSALSKSSDGVIERALQVASAMLEVSVDDLAFVGGGVQVKGAPERRLELGTLAAAARKGTGLPEGLNSLTAEQTFAADGNAIPFAAVLSVVKIDRDTGRVKLDRLVAVDDIGTAVNPLIVDGQVAGGLAQGIAEALYEAVQWDEDGQLLTATLQDYAVPTAEMVPDYELDLTVTPSPFNPIGAKGVGESGCVSAPPSIVNAVLDALAPFGIDDVPMPMTSEKIWRALREKGA